MKFDWNDIVIKKKKYISFMTERKKYIRLLINMLIHMISKEIILSA